jgi:phosphatidylinositol 4-kinase
MDPLTHLCDLISQNPDLLSDKLSWLCSRCPSLPSSPSSPSSYPRLTSSQLNSLLSLARLLSLRSFPSSYFTPLLNFLSNPPLTPSSFPPSISPSNYLSSLLHFTSQAADLSPDLSTQLSSFFATSILSAIDLSPPNEVSNSFLSAISRNCPPIAESESAQLIERLLQEVSRYDVPLPVYKGKKKEEEEESSSSPSISRSSFGSGEGGIEVVVKKEVVGFEEEDIAGLERQEIIFGVFAQVIEKVGNIKMEKVDKVREAATKQIKSLPAFLKIRKRDWREQGGQLKSRINKKVSCCQAAISVQIKTLLSRDRFEILERCAASNSCIFLGCG